MRIMVTGSEGFIGKYLCRRLIKDGHYVARVDIKHRTSEVSQDEDRFAIDLANHECVGDLANVIADEKIGAIFHLAAVNGTPNFYERASHVLDVGLTGTMLTTWVAGFESVPRFIFFSSSEVYGDCPVIPTPESAQLVVPDPKNPRYSYAASKIAGESIALTSSIPNVIVVRPFNVYGPDMGENHVIPQLIRKVQRARETGATEIEVINPMSVRSFCYIDDFIELLMQVAFFDGRHVFNIGTAFPIHIADLATMISSAMGRPLDWRPARGHEGSPVKRLPDLHKLTLATGDHERTGLSAGLRKTIAWYEGNKP